MIKKTNKLERVGMDNHVGFNPPKNFSLHGVDLKGFEKKMKSLGYSFIRKEDTEFGNELKFKTRNKQFWIGLGRGRNSFIPYLKLAGHDNPIKVTDLGPIIDYFESQKNYSFD